MLIIGAKGFAKEVLEVCHQNNDLENLSFYDDVNEDIGEYLYQKFPVLNRIEQAVEYFQTVDQRFTIGIGNPNLREMLCKKFTDVGGKLTTTIASSVIIGNYNNTIPEGCNIMQNVVLTNDVTLGKGVIINQMSSIGHDVYIGDFVEVCPNVSISGNCKIGKNSFLGTGAIILPQVEIGQNVVIGAGAVVSKNLPDNCVAVGIPAKIIKQN